MSETSKDLDAKIQDLPAKPVTSEQGEARDEDVESDQKAEVILLEDLALRKDVKAGCGGILFGEAFDPAGETDA